MEARSDSDRRFRLVVEAAPSAMVMVDSEGLIALEMPKPSRYSDTRGPNSSDDRSKCLCPTVSVASIPAFAWHFSEIRWRDLWARG